MVLIGVQRQQTPAAPRVQDQYLLLEPNMCGRCIGTLGSTNSNNPETICESLRMIDACVLYYYMSLAIRSSTGMN